jgi:hypothetical protein
MSRPDVDVRLTRGCDDVCRNRLRAARRFACAPSGKNDRSLLEDPARVELGFAALRDAQKRNALSDDEGAELAVRAVHEARRASV